MKYVALLRGVNVGGNTLIKMSDLKKAAENRGFKNVSTYIQSGNIIFNSNESPENIIAKLEQVLTQRFNYDSAVIIKTIDQLEKILAEVPDDWKKSRDMRCYLAFVKEPITTIDVAREARPKEGVDFVKEGDGIVYMSTLLSGLTKNGFTKLITTKVYKFITIRSYSTAQKLLEGMEH